MKILLIGGFEFIGKELGKALVRSGHTLNILIEKQAFLKNYLSYPASVYFWNKEELPPREALENVEAIVHFTENLKTPIKNSKEMKQKIEELNVIGMENLVNQLKKLSIFPQVWISISMIGHEENVKKTFSQMHVFLKLIQNLEEKISSVFIRKVNLKLGMILNHQEGIFVKLIPWFQAGIRVLGHHQWRVNWIHIEDLVRLIQFAIFEKKLNGTYYAVAQEQVTGYEFNKIFSKILRNQWNFSLPSRWNRLIDRETNQFLFSDQKMESIQSLGFSFRYDTLKKALISLFPAQDHHHTQFYYTQQWVPRLINEVFQFFSLTKNLALFYPPSLKLRLSPHSASKVHQGAILDYRFFYYFPMRWVNRIDHYNPPTSYSISQIKGPYLEWHYCHQFEQLGDGTLIIDEIKYRVPLGKLGIFLLANRVRHDLDQTFEYRCKKIKEIFPSTSQEKG